MIFVSSDLASSLRHWEFAEYISEGFVIIGCAGELVADLSTKLGERRKKHIERWSTILLVAALTVGLKCLVRTNELSGNVIGSLGEKAEEADTKAKAAITDSSMASSQAKDALNKAGATQQSLGKAEDEANKHGSPSSNALTLSRDARREADSFEKDILSAKKQAAEAESHLAEAMRRANSLTAELDRLTTSRLLPHSIQVLSSLTRFNNTEYMFTDVCADTECIALLRDIDNVLQLAKWKRIKAPDTFPGFVLWGERGDDDGVGISLEPGIKIRVESPQWPAEERLPVLQLPQHLQAAVALNLTLAANVSPPENTGTRVNGTKGAPQSSESLLAGNPYPEPRGKTTAQTRAVVLLSQVCSPACHS